MQIKSKRTFCKFWITSVVSIFNILDGPTTSKKSPWRFRVILLSAAIMGTLSIVMLHYKIKVVYPRQNQVATLPDITQILNDYLQYLIDLYYINKYDRDACANYYCQYTIIDNFLGRQPDSEIKQSLAKLIGIFTFIWFINFILHYTALWYNFWWQYPMIFVPFHLFVFSKILTTLFLSAHTIRIESRLRMVGDVIEDCYRTGEGRQNVNEFNDCSMLTARFKHSSETQQQPSQILWHYNYKKVVRLNKFYLILTEQCEFVNNMYGIRILLLSLNLTIDMVRFINSIYRYAGENQLTGSYPSSYALASASVTRTLVCAAMLFSLVHHCERAYRQTDRIIRISDRVLITGNNKGELQTSVSELRELVVSRPVSFTVARFFRLEYPALTAVAATVVSYSIILFQSIASEAETTTEEVPSISFFTLYRFADRKDKCFIAIAIIFSMLCGCSTPINTLLFADLLQAMVMYGLMIIGDDEFMREVTNFAMWNSLVGVAIVALTYGATVLMNMAAYNQMYRLRQAYLKAALNQDFAYFDMHQTGDFASKMTSDVIKVEDGIGEKLATFIFFQSAFVSSVAMALIKGWKLALLCLVTFPITLFLVGLAGLVSSKLSKSEAVASGKAGSIAEEVLSSIRTVYAFNGQEKEVDRYHAHQKDVRSINIKKGFFNGLAMGTLFFCIFCSYALSFWFGYQLMRDEPENYDVATMIAVFFGVLMGSMNFGISSTLMEVFGIARGAGAQIFYLLDNEPTINPLLNQGVTPDNVEGNIELKNVVFHYPSRPDVPVLRGVNLSVKRGQSVALVGHSGCGKSTIIQLVSRYYDVIDGNVEVDGHDVRELSVRWLRAQIGLVGQEPVLFNTTVRENIRYGREDASDADIEAAAREANAHQFIMKLPKGYDTVVGERGASLSGGQKQRIAIARALVRNPRILLLDEATSALDLSSEAKVQKALDKAQEGRTTIVVAHRLTTIRNVDVIYVFKSGMVVEVGNHVELMKRKGHYYDMVMLQSSPDSETTPIKDGERALTREISVRSDKDDDEDEIFESKEEANDESDEMQDVSFWRVIRLNSPEWKSISFASIASLLTGFAMPLLAVILGDFIGVLSNPNEEEVIAEVRRFALIFVGIGAFSGVANFIQVFFFAIAGEYLTERLRNLMFRKLLTQEIAFYDDKNHSTGALCAKLAGETASVQGATGQRIGTVLQAVGTFTFALFLSLTYEWRVGLVALTFVPLIVAILYKQGRMMTAESFGTAKTMEQSSKVAVEAVTNVRTVASLGREQQFLAEYAVLLTPALELARRSAHIRAIVFGLSRGLFNFVYAAALYYGGTLIVYDNVSYEVVLKSAQALLMGASSATQAFAFGPNFQKGIKAAGRIVVLLNRESNITDPDKPAVENFKGTGESSLQRVQFRYPTRPNIPVLRGLDLEIERGKTIALVGVSGCGKSTVIQLMERYYDPEDGVVAQDGIPLKMLRLADARRSIGFVQQEPILFDRTIGENIAYGDNSRKPSMDEIFEAAKNANIHNFIVSLPMGYETNIGSKGTQLSGGQKQRVAIARALIRRPQMLLLDEATSALDTESEKVVQEALDRAKEGRTCVMIAHRLSTVRDADAICVVHEGRVAERGTHSELLELRGLYYNLNRKTYS